MQTVDEQPETIHLYVVRETDSRPPLYPIVCSALALITLVLVCSLALFQPPVVHTTLRVPAILLPPKTFTATTAIIPTGTKVYPATTAHGVLTITNGSIIGQSIPADFTIQGVATDSAVDVPAGSANGYGYATVSAHALMSGKAGNFATLAINAVIGSSVYIRNVRAFSGGRDRYSIKVITAQDRSAATTKARNMLLTLSTGLHYPCNEDHVADAHHMLIVWHCRFISYHIATFYHVTRVKIIGQNLLISAWFMPRPVRYWVK